MMVTLREIQDREEFIVKLQGDVTRFSIGYYSHTSYISQYGIDEAEIAFLVEYNKGKIKQLREKLKPVLE